MAYWARDLIWASRPVFVQPGAVDLQFDGRVLAFTAGVSLLTGVVFGLAPALQGSRADLVTELKDRTSAPSGHRWYGARNLLVMAQVALSFVALASAGMFLRSLANARGIDPGLRRQPTRRARASTPARRASTRRARASSTGGSPNGSAAWPAWKR